MVFCEVGSRFVPLRRRPCHLLPRSAGKASPRPARHGTGLSLQIQPPHAAALQPPQHHAQPQPGPARAQVALKAGPPSHPVRMWVRPGAPLALVRVAVDVHVVAPQTDDGRVRAEAGDRRIVKCRSPSARCARFRWKIGSSRPWRTGITTTPKSPCSGGRKKAHVEPARRTRFGGRFLLTRFTPLHHLSTTLEGKMTH